MKVDREDGMGNDTEGAERVMKTTTLNGITIDDLARTRSGISCITEESNTWLQEWDEFERGRPTSSPYPRTNQTTEDKA